MLICWLNMSRTPRQREAVEGGSMSQERRGFWPRRSSLAAAIPRNHYMEGVARLLNHCGLNPSYMLNPHALCARGVCRGSIY